MSISAACAICARNAPAVELSEITILAVSAAAQGRLVSYVDRSGVAAEAWALPSMTGPILEGKTFQRVTGLLHRVSGANQIVLVFDDDLR